MIRCVLLLAVLAVAVAGCGEDDAPRPRSAVVDQSREPPYVGALAVNPRDGSLLMATNSGTFRVARGSRDIERVPVRVRAGERSGPAQRGLAFSFTGPDTLVGSGHPGPGRAVSPLLGLIRSSDGGRTWRNVSRLGQSDLHSVLERGRTVLASDGAEAKVLVSTDGGRSFRSWASPLRLIDLEASPRGPSQLVASSESGVHTSDDGGRTWRSRDAVPGSRFAWPSQRALFRVDGDGAVKRSADAGHSWRDVGVVEGQPQALAAAGDTLLYAAGLDGVIRRSRDAGRTWSVRARARP